MSRESKGYVSRVVEAGYQLSPDGFDYLRGLDEDAAEELIERAIQEANRSPEPLFILGRDFLHSLTEKREEAHLVGGARTRRPLASEMESRLEVVPEEEAAPAGDVEGFIEYFRSRFERISRIMRSRADVKDAEPIGQALRAPLRSKLKVIGIVTEKRARGHRLFLELEDPEDSVTVMASDAETVRKGLEVLQDQVICVDGVKYKEDLIIANDFIWPDIPSKRPNRAEEPVCAAFIADVHIGSRYFRGDFFDRFLGWMNMEVGPPASRWLASRVKYLIVGGDIVDGIGVYPEQEEELIISDVREQYKAAASLLEKVPEYVEIVVIPGNHDAVRKSLPQPPIPRDYAEPLYLDERTHMLGNPCRLRLSGVEALVCHGKALDDILSSTPGHDFHHPVRAVELLLRCRHLAPTYGSTTPIAPERTDRLVIPSAPDIFQMGHIHVNESRRYKGTTLIASGAFQEQTPFQRRVNLEPTPGVASIVDLQTHQLLDLDFRRLS